MKSLPNRLNPRGGLASVEELLARWLTDHRSVANANRKSVEDAWKAVVGEQISSHSRVTDCSRGELVIEVDSAPLLTELSTYYRHEILESIRRIPQFQGVQVIRFRAGSS